MPQSQSNSNNEFSMIGSTGLLLAYYGDDFTGSTDVMEALSLAGLRTVLFLRPPVPEQLERYPGLRAIGVAGDSRSLSPEAMEAELRPVFRSFQGLRAPLVHYKICSTFDSSPRTGSIGKAIDLGKEIFDTPTVPLLAAAPVLGRYCVFGNLFARSGLDSEPFRLDRHPTMRRHPVTPMNESDLREILSRQTQAEIALFDVLKLASANRRELFAQCVAQQPGVVIFDLLEDSQLGGIGELIWRMVQPGSSTFAAGSSGVEYALTAYWREQGLIPKTVEKTGMEPAGAMLVISGSCSPVTERQIRHAVEKGFAPLEAATGRLLRREWRSAEMERLIREAVRLLKRGESVLIHFAKGPDDPRIAETRAWAAAQDRAATSDKAGAGELLGDCMGELASGVLSEHRPPRMAVTGGDSSTRVARKLGAEALEFLASAYPGSPLCRLHAPGRPWDGLEAIFKGGQVGKPDMFARVLAGDFQ